MGVYIKGMEMPDKCCECKIRYEMFCPLLHRFIADEGRRHNCPLVEVPPHGDLIDQAVAVQVAMEWCPDDDGTVGKIGDLRELLDEIEALPIIIEAEE